MDIAETDENRYFTEDQYSVTECRYMEAMGKLNSELNPNPGLSGSSAPGKTPEIV